MYSQKHPVFAVDYDFIPESVCKLTICSEAWQVCGFILRNTLMNSSSSFGGSYMMKPTPILHSTRLKLRFFEPSDAPVVDLLLGDSDASTAIMPQPYDDGPGVVWVADHQSKYEEELINFAITLKSTAVLIGGIGLRINPSFDRAELGYWIGKPFWGQGYCTEAARTILLYSFTTLNLNRVFSSHDLDNLASGKVLEKIGMKKEGVARQHYKAQDKYTDSVEYGILRSEFNFSNLLI